MHFAKRLRQERLRRHLTQEALAKAVGISPRSIARWEQGRAIPQISARLLLSRFFGFRLDELFEGNQEHTPGAPPSWSVPYPRNPLFTGRDEILLSLHKQFTREHAMALTQSLAISGLGGIGKTQIALEYAYQYRQDYRFVFWTSAATRETLQAGIATLAHLLQLSERNEQDQNKVVQAVRQWFATNEGWLWILDNADDVTMVLDILPTERPGHLLFTSRAQAWGSLAQRIEIETMGLAEGTLFLLRRAKLLAPDGSLDQIAEGSLTTAEAIIREMDFLPLALDQAGAYIEEVGCSLLDYRQLYQTYRKDLLQRRSHLSSNYPESVATTWSLSFQKIEQANPAAADILRLCSFLDPDAIPEELINTGSIHLSPVLDPIAANPLQVNKAIEELRQFSLIQRYSETRMLRIHRLVQAVLKDTMERDSQCQWAQRAVRVVKTIFPEHIEVDTWPVCQRYLPQAQACSQLIRDYGLTSPEAAMLLTHTARYLHEQMLYERAQYLYQQAMHIWEQMLGSDHLNTITVCNHLADLYQNLGQHEKAEQLYLRVLRVREEASGPDHPDVSNPLIGLAQLSHLQGKYEQAEPLYRRALQIREQTLASHPLNIIDPLLGLARLTYRQGKYEQAKSLYQRILSLWEQALGPDHLNVAIALNGLAIVFVTTGKYEQAEPLLWRALQIREQTLASHHPDVASVLNNLAELYRKQRKYEQAESLCEQAVRIWEQSDGSHRHNIAFALDNLADLYQEQGKDEQAEPLYRRALQVREQMLGSYHPYIADSLIGLANLYQKQRKDEQAEPLYQRAVQIREQVLGLQHPETAETLYNFAVFREAQGRNQEAQALYQRALAIQEHIFGPEHPTTTITRTAYSTLLQTPVQHNDKISGEDDQIELLEG